MRQATEAFLAALRAPHTLAVRADLLVGREPHPDLPDGLPVIGGSVSLDRKADIRGHCDVTIAAPGLIPHNAFDPVTPFGAELQLWRGVNLSTGPELKSLGIFGIQDTKTDDKGGTIRISGLDRSQLVKDADFENSYVVAAGTNYADAIQEIIAAGVPGFTYLFSSTDAVTPLLVFDVDTGGGRWAAALSMATSIGCDLYFDGDGRCILEPVPDPRSDPVTQLEDGPGGVVVTAGKTWSRTDSYNAVIAYSSNPADTGTPARAAVYDDDPTSPTYYFGPFGKKPRRYASPLITTVTQAQSAAEGLLRQVLGVSQSLDLSVVPNPALEPGDIVQVRRTTLDVNEVVVLDSLTVGLSAGDAMTAGVRARQVAQ